MAPKSLIWILLLLPFSIWCHTVTIGSGTVLHQGLPIEPAARFSYSQQLFYGAEIAVSGSITHIGFQYRVGSANFFEGNKQLRLYLGSSNLNYLEAWTEISELSLVYDGLLMMDFFDAGLPGSGWLMIPLHTPFNYDAQTNLLLAVDENSDASGATSDDFFCRSTASVRALQYQSPSINPDPYNPPNAANAKSFLSNLRISFGGSSDAPANLTGYYSEAANHLSWDAPVASNIAAYRVNRNGNFLAECTATQYLDTAIEAGQSYLYNVQVRYADGTISGYSNTVQILVPPVGTQYLIDESFEACPPFGTVIPGWQNLDLDGSLSWSWDHIDFPHEGESMAWLVFSPQQCSPALTDISAASGSQMLMATSSVNPPNSDWLISPSLHLGTATQLSFMARSYTAAYGMERLKILISTSNATPAAFAALHTEAYVSVPASWTEYRFDLTAYSHQDVYFALACVSLDAFALFIDDILLSSEGGALALEDLQMPIARVQNYPNPCRKSFHLDSPHYFDAKIYNIKGQLLHSVVRQKQMDSSSLQLPAGLYLIRIQDPAGSYTLKQVVLP